MTDVAVVRTGSANLASVFVALERLGGVPRLVDRPDEVVAADRLVLPGVGAFASAMGVLERADLVEPVRAYAAAGRPLLAICLGFQLLAESSEEGGEVRGLGVIPGRVTRFASDVRVPQFGWNRVEWDGSGNPARQAYFDNS